MNILGYTIEADLRSRQPITHFRIHRHRRDATYSHLVWWRLSILYGRTHSCEECGVETGLDTHCLDCYEHHFCECGQRLEDSWGQPGDGFCARCR